MNKILNFFNNWNKTMCFELLPCNFSSRNKINEVIYSCLTVLCEKRSCLIRSKKKKQSW